MKSNYKQNDSSNLTQSSQSLNLTQHSQSIEYSHQTNILCSGNNQAFNYCFNDKCKQLPIFTCFNYRCYCHKQHRICPKGSIHTTLQVISSKILQTDIKNSIQKQFDKLIDQLSQFRDSLLLQVEKIKFFSLHQVQKKILKISKNQLLNKNINNQQASEMWKIITNNQKQKYNVFQQLKKDLLKFEQNFTQNLSQMKQNITNYQTLSAYQSKKCKSITSKSKICKQKQQGQRVINMFSKLKPIKNINLLFRASQYQFDLNKFHELCNTQNVMILTLTDKDKIFGGYTPLNFTKNMDNWIQDDKRQSFLFSVNQNQRFELANSTNGLYSYSSKSTIQMGSDFYIKNKANTTKCQIGTQNYYINSKYKNDQQSFLKLNGNKTNQCYLKQWEVFKIQFQTY